ncbi:hypothetical protein GCM10023213_37150 [Prosthecobacter algae]|uniref:Plasmid stabilization system protein ParE n=1 Tax=Prosthecobacter algae TaxID=1144682 RepID=A0ABP9PEV9_9BACT
MKVAYHEAAKTDYDEILTYLESISERVADQFEKEFQQTLTKARTNPYHFPPLTNSSDKRRANIKRYNHHFIYEVNEIADEIRILIIKHDKRHPSHGLNRS